jgi:leader peptidase (prepilin peptidase)/N-methyltransferase
LTPFYIFLFFIFGAALGSFSSAIFYRERIGMSWISNIDGVARSKCPKCDCALKVKHLVPIASWLIQKGKCGYCGAKIPSFYILLEVFSALIVAFGYILLQNPLKALFLAVLYPFFVSFLTLYYRFHVFSKRLFTITIILSLLFYAFIFIFADNTLKY